MHQHNSPRPQHSAGIGHSWWMLGLCLLPIAAVAAVTLFGVSPSNLLFYGLLLACPLLHVFLMRGHGHGGSAPPAPTVQDAASQDGRP